MKYFPKLLFILYLTSPIVSVGQINKADWIVRLTEEIVNETDLCERCTWVNPTISEVEFGKETYYFLRYSCSTTEAFARMYDEEGNILGECISSGGNSNCGLGFNAFTIYTFADGIRPLWNCDRGFECAFSLENNIEQIVPISVDDSRCIEGIKTLGVSDEFVSYNWRNNEQVLSNQSSLEVNKGGSYFVTVTDKEGCTIAGEIDIPDITALHVKIKGPTQVCSSSLATLKTSTFQSYQWSTNSTDSLITVSEKGTYQLTVTNDQGCQGSASFALTNFDPIDLSIHANTSSINEGDSINIVVVRNLSDRPQIVAYEWEGAGLLACKDCAETTFMPFADGELHLSVTDEYGCTAATSLFINVVSLPQEVYAPNVFKPNGQGDNAAFTIYGGTNLRMIESLAIFDRWGNLLFSKTNFSPNQIADGWDGRSNGKNLMPDVYLFMATLLFANGQRKMIKGDVLLFN